jgi:hypothetical protein
VRFTEWRRKSFWLIVFGVSTICAYPVVNLIDMVARLKTTTSVVMAQGTSHDAGGVLLQFIQVVFLQR